jgi:hypothetical protein
LLAAASDQQAQIDGQAFEGGFCRNLPFPEVIRMGLYGCWIS